MDSCAIILRLLDSYNHFVIKWQKLNWYDKYSLFLFSLPDEIEARIAADVFRSQRGALSSLLQHSLGDISNELYAQSIITKSSMKRAMNETQIASDRTVVLLSAVEDKIEEDSQSFTKFVRVLESEPCWKSLATKLVKTYHKGTSSSGNYLH